MELKPTYEDLESKLEDSKKMFQLLIEQMPSAFAYNKVIIKNEKCIDFEYLKVNKPTFLILL